jgi:hypothetical protein
MGILNVTPDSFSDGGKFYGEGKAAEWARRTIEKGAAMIRTKGGILFIGVPQAAGKMHYTPGFEQWGRPKTCPSS